MTVSIVVLVPGAVAALLASIPAAAQGVLRGTDPLAVRAPADPPGVQTLKLPSGTLLKRLPGEPALVDPSSPADARASRAQANAAVQQVGNALMQLPGPPEPSASPARGPQLTARQVGPALLLEIPGQPVPGANVAAARTAVPSTGRVVDLAPGQPLPLNPGPDTLYRRLPTPP